MFRGNITMKGYLKNPDGDRGGVPRRLVPLRRPRGDASRRLREDQGPLQGRDHLGRREHLLAGSRGRAVRPPGGDAGRGGRAARSEVGRDAVRVRRAEGGRVGDRGGDHRVLPRAHGALQGARRRWSSGRCPRPPPARSRSSSCASARRARRPSNEQTMREGPGAVPRPARVPLHALHGVGRPGQPARAGLRARPHAQRPRLRLPRAGARRRLPRGLPRHRRAAAAATGCATRPTTTTRSTAAT